MMPLLRRSGQQWAQSLPQTLKHTRFRWISLTPPTQSNLQTEETVEVKTHSLGKETLVRKQTEFRKSAPRTRVMKKTPTEISKIKPFKMLPIGHKSQVRSPHTPRHMQKQVVNPLQGQLHRPTEIQNALDCYQFAIVGGPGYTGKTEQIDLAVPDRVAIEIKKEYLSDIFGGQIPDEAWDNYEQYKEGEKAWLEKNIDRLVDKLGDDESDTVAIDEADYHGIHSELLVKLISDLNERGKRVLLVLHPDGLNNHHFLSLLEEAGVYQNADEQMIQTGWYTREEEANMLRAAGYDPAEAELIMQSVRGNPTAYIGILKDASLGKLRPELRLPVEKFLKRAKSNTERMINISNQTGDFPTAIRLSNSPVYQKTPGQLVAQFSIMSYKSHEKWMQDAVRIALAVNGIPINDEQSGFVDHWMSGNPNLDQIRNCLQTALTIGLPIRLTRCSAGNPYLIANREKIDFLQEQVLRVIGTEISAIGLPTEAGNWWDIHRNSAATVEELQQDAKRSWPALKKIAQDVANQFPGVYIDAGPDDKFAVKGIKRMQEKAKGYMESGLSQKEAVGQLTDPLRVTIVIGEKATATYAEVADYLNTVLKQNPKIRFHIFMNKFDNCNPKKNPTAYGAVHAAAMLNNDDGSQVYLEIQIHKEEPVLKVKNGAMHQLYETTRTREVGLDTKQKGTRAQQLLSTAAHFETLDDESKKNIQLSVQQRAVK